MLCCKPVGFPINSSAFILELMTTKFANKNGENEIAKRPKEPANLFSIKSYSSTYDLFGIA